MALQRMDNVLIVVDDLDAVKAFFLELGLEGETTVEGPEVGRLIFLDISIFPSAGQRSRHRFRRSRSRATDATAIRGSVAGGKETDGTGRIPGEGRGEPASPQAIPVAK